MTKLPENTVKMTKFQCQILKNIDTRDDRTYEELYQSFCGERTRSAIKSCLHTLVTKKLVYARQKNRITMAKYFLTDLGKNSYQYWDQRRNYTFSVKNSFPKKKVGLCDGCMVFVGELTRVKKGETSEGENTYKYLCRGCLCPDDDLCIEREVLVRQQHHLRTADDFETITVGDIEKVNRALKKFGKGFKVNFGRRE